MQRYYAWLLVVTAMVITNVTYGFYDPNLQRWVNRDPIGDAASLAFETWDRDALVDDPSNNPYGFIENDSVNDVDLFGLVKRRSQKTPGNCNKGQLKRCKQICGDQGKEVASCNIIWERKLIWREKLPNGWISYYKDTQWMKCVCKDPPPPFDRCPTPPPPNLRRNLPPELPPTSPYIPPPPYIPPSRWEY